MVAHEPLLNIAIVTPRMNSAGGVERVTATWSNYFAGRWHHRTQLVIATSHDSFFAVDENVIRVSPDLGSGKSILARITRLVRWFFWLGHWLQHHAESLNYLIVNTTACAVYTLFWRWLFGLHVKIVVCEHLECRGASRGWWRLRRWLYPDAFAIVSLTEQDLECYARFNRRVVHLPNPVLLRSVAPVSRATKTALSIGRLEYQKAHELLLDAWSSVHRRHPDWSLKIVGEGSLRNALQAQIAALGLTGAVTILPPVTDIAELYSSASLFVLSSRFEGLPVTLLEAQACGLPCVSYDCPTGPREVIHHGIDGYLVALGDVAGLAAGICGVIESDRYQEMSIAAKAASNRFDADAIMARWAHYLEVEWR